MTKSQREPGEQELLDHFSGFGVRVGAGRLRFHARRLVFLGVVRGTWALKRVIDVVGAGLGMIVLMPFFLTLAALIKLDSPGPLLFGQTRIGRRGKPFTTAFAAGKAAQRSLCQSLARQLGPEGIHVALIIIDGMVDLPASRQRFADRPDAAWVSPDGYADVLLFLAKQDRRAWTFELEVRPHVESW